MAAAPEPYPLAAWKKKDRAFTVYSSPIFPSLQAVVEDQAVVEARKYFAQVSLKDPVKASEPPIFERVDEKNVHDDDAFDKALFASEGPAASAGKEQLPSGKKLEAKSQVVEHRLDLVVRASIARLGANGGEVAMYLLGDNDAKRDGVDPPGAEDVWRAELEGDEKRNGAATRWLRHRSKILDRVVAQDHDAQDRDGVDALDRVGLATFSARIIVNLNTKDGRTQARAVTAGEWNNVVPWKAHKGHYGRNFAVATARTHTLRGEGSLLNTYDFDATKDFKCLEGLGLTEHCFFTLYPLVKIGNTWIDAFSKKEVSATAFKTIRKIDAINFVKIILMYVIDGGGALQLKWCYLDGIRAKVH
jgi:hypothetical protein